MDSGVGQDTLIDKNKHGNEERRIPMNEIIQKVQQAMNIIASVKPRVDQVNEITLPLVNVVNLLAEARDKLKRLDEQKAAKPDEEA